MISNDDSPLPDTEVHYLRSEQVGDEFKLLLGHCGSRASGPVPVLFLGDAWASFGTAVESIRLLRLWQDVPPILVIGIGYRATAMDELLPLRTRDFTPTVDSRHSGEDPSMIGGADRFLTFIRDELKPWVDQRYAAETDDSAFFGHSDGGLLATYVLLNHPATFRRYGIASPSLYWDDEMMFETESEYARTHDDLAAAVFFSIGAYENPAGRNRYLAQLPANRRAEAEAEDDGYSAIDSVADTTRMVATLHGRAYPSLKIDCEVLPGEYHLTVPALSLSRSVRYLFGAPR